MDNNTAAAIYQDSVADPAAFAPRDGSQRIPGGSWFSRKKSLYISGAKNDITFRTPSLGIIPDERDSMHRLTAEYSLD